MILSEFAGCPAAYYHRIEGIMSDKRPYSTPSLSLWGTVTDLTKGGGNNPSVDITLNPFGISFQGSCTVVIDGQCIVP